MATGTAPEEDGTQKQQLLEDDLKHLRKGRSVLASDLRSRVGPTLAETCGIAEGDDQATVRRKVIERLSELCAHLPEDLALIARVSFGLHRDARHRVLQDRLGWAAAQIQRDLRTVRRRADEALVRLVEEAITPTSTLGQSASATTSPYLIEGWHVESVRTLLLLDRDPPELIEERKIVVTAARLDEIAATFSLPPYCNDSQLTRDLLGQVLHGGALLRKEHPSQSYFRFVIGLPRSLARGESHEYGLLLTLPEQQHMAPYYAYVPVRGCAHFELRVRFAVEQIPKHAWKLAGLPRRVIDDPRVDEEIIEVDRFGEARVEFRGLKQGLGYGVQWGL